MQVYQYMVTPKVKILHYCDQDRCINELVLILKIDSTVFLTKMLAQITSFFICSG